MILVVSLARARSSVFMRCCIDLGLKVRYLTGVENVNPDGDYESYESNRGVDTYSDEYEENEALKIMFPAFLFKSKIDPKTKLIILLRTPEGVVRSQGKIGMGQPKANVRRMNYWRLMAQLNEWVNKNNNPILFVDTDDMMVNPEKWLHKVAEFTGAEIINVKKAAGLIDAAKSVVFEEIIEDAASEVYQKMKEKCYTAI